MIGDQAKSRSTHSALNSGQSSLVGGAVDGSGCLYFVDNAAFKVYKETPSAGGYSLTEIASGLNFPSGSRSMGTETPTLPMRGTSRC